LDLGCGPKGITHELAARVGAGGHVTGLDADEDFIQLANSQRLPNTDYMLGDAYSTGLPDEAFDFVHMRFLASTAGHPDRLAGEAVRLARDTDPGQSRKCHCSPRNSADATETSVLMLRARASGDASPTVLCSFAVPRRCVAPQVNRSDSRSVVFPLR
jgi:SAM-dependent methyltransferase